jgi:hypothetical protein
MVARPEATWTTAAVGEAARARRVGPRMSSLPPPQQYTHSNDQMRPSGYPAGTTACRGDGSLGRALGGGGSCNGELSLLPSCESATRDARVRFVFLLRVEGGQAC